MTSLTLPRLSCLRSMGLVCAILLSAPHLALAADHPVTAMVTATQTGRYSVITAQPGQGQRDLLTVIRTIRIPNDRHSVGDVVRWVLQDSGYRLVDDAMLSEEARAMLGLPLPAVHRHFDLLPLYTVLELIIGPAFHLVEDPVHRLIAFERCAGVARTKATGDQP